MRKAPGRRTGRRRVRVRYHRPSILEGMARVLDIGRTMSPKVEVLHPRSESEQIGFAQDEEELREIWYEVGDYLYDAMEELERDSHENVDGSKRQG